MVDAPQFTPVHLITGFLGSGKTTLLQRLLADPALADTAVLINEFGEVGLDHHLLERIDERTVLLQSGCLCCTIRGELADSIRTLHSRRARGEVPGFRRLVIESTGLADPFPVLTTLHADPVLKHHFRMAGVITTVDAVNGSAQLASYAESRKQVAVADTLVITKTDLVGAEAVAALVEALRALNPSANRLMARDLPLHLRAWAAKQTKVGGRGDTPALEGALASLLSDTVFNPAAHGDAVAAWFAAESPHHHAPHDRNRHGGIEAFAIVTDRALDWTLFGLWLTMLLNRHGETILRVKGILSIAGEPAPVAIHGVQHLVHPPVHLRAWPDAERRSRIVFIVDGLERAAIERSFAQFMALAGPDAAAA